MSRLRPFQQQIKTELYQRWQEGLRNVLIVSATGSGKSVMSGDVMREYVGASVAIAHRSELVTQLSTALARERVAHRVIGPSSLVRNCQAVQMALLGRHWVDPGARAGVAGVDTLVRRDVSHDSWFREVGLKVGDEAHHVQKENKWGKGFDMFPNAYGLGYTATPQRADGRGLSADSHGVFDAMVEGPDMRHLIDSGYLTDYRIFAPPSDVIYDEVTVSASGDLSMPKLRAAVHKSDQFVGDIVKHYLRIAPGKLGVTFAVDIESATEIAAAFRTAGVPAEVVSSKTDDLNRIRLLKAFARREILQLVNVDLFGEGFDLPAIEVVSMGRKTESLALYMQQFGRALRLMVDESLQADWGSFTDAQRLAYIAASTKPKAIIIDHVQNVARHGLPDSPRVWSLAARSSRGGSGSDAIPVRVCPNPAHPQTGVPCLFVYERFRSCCPDCQHVPEIVNRSGPEFVDGDLFELSAETLAALRGEAARIMRPPYVGAPPYVNTSFQERVIAHHALRDAAAIWAGWEASAGYTHSESYRRFYHSFGVDMLTAQTLSRPDAEALTGKIHAVLTRNNIQPKVIQ